jgi:hypothetical protein
MFNEPERCGMADSWQLRASVARGQRAKALHVRQQRLQANRLESCMRSPKSVAISGRRVCADLVPEEGGQPLLVGVPVALRG